MVRCMKLSKVKQKFFSMGTFSLIITSDCHILVHGKKGKCHNVSVYGTE